MAESILKLRVDSQEYDQKIKRAKDGLLQMEAACRKVGGTFEVVEKDQLAFVQSLGKMQTVSNTTKGKLRELTDAVNDMTAMYRNLTDAEKQAPFGQALKKSIDELVQRAGDAKDVLADMAEEINHVASDTGFSDSMNMMTSTVGSCASAIVAWTGDSKEMEQVIKDLAKIQTTIKAVEQLTKAFQAQNLVLLKNPYVLAAAALAAIGYAAYKVADGYKKARTEEELFDAVQSNAKDTYSETQTKIEMLNDRMRDNTLSIDERKSALEGIKSVVTDYHGDLTAEGTLINDNADALTTYVTNLEKAARAQAAFGLIADLTKKKLEAELALRREQEALANDGNFNAFAGGGPSNWGGANTASNVAISMYQSQISAAEAEIKTLKRMIDTEDVVSSLGGNTTTTTPITTPKKPNNNVDKEQRAYNARIRAANMARAANEADTRKGLEEGTALVMASAEGLQGQLEEVFAEGSMKALNQELAAAKDAMDSLTIGSEEWEDALAWVNDVSGRISLANEKFGDMGKAIKDNCSAVSELGSAFAQLGSVMNNTTGNIIAGFGQTMSAIAKMIPALEALSIAQGTKVATSSSQHWIEAIAAIASVVATITATFSKLHFASGGIVPGNNLSGDKVPAMVNSGELILNRAQQGAIASQLRGDAQRSFALSATIRGEDIRLALDNNNRRRGRGEYVMSR